MLISLLFVLQVAVTAPSTQAPLSAPVAIERQIFWQRSLEDALAISAAEQRPLLIAVNMDGESASENIVRERYRDPKFVALTRRFVCIAASAFRHGERDHTFDGARVVSPRLGEVTSGEAIALEPILFDKYLGGERIAPRHALILLDGKKQFDHFQLFDLRDLDRELEASQALAPPAAAPDLSPIDAAKLTDADWLRLARAKDNRQRGRFEALLLPPAPIANVDGALRALLEVGDKSSLEALRIIFARAGEAPGRIAPRAVFVARAHAMEADVALMLWEMLIDVPDSNAKVSLVRRAELLDALAALDSATPRNRALILSYAVAGDGATERAHALSLCAAGPVNEMSQAIAAAGGAIDPVRVLAATQAILREAPWQLPDELPPSEAVEAELLAADDNLSSHLDDAQAQLRFGKAALLAARSRDALKVAGVETLLVDAQAALNKVVASSPKNSDAWLRLARVCYLSNDFAAEERAALGALAAAPELDASAVDRLLGRAEASAEQISLAARSLAQFKEQRMEALRWLADACARQLGNPWREDFAAEAANMARGLNAACLAALSPISNPTDWLTLSAYYAALGRRSEEISIARAGLDFFPDAQELRNAFYLAFWDRGYSAEARRQSEAIADRHADSAAARWYVGYAAMREGDTLRRAEDPKRAIAAYELADKAFQQSVQMSPSYQDSADFYRALAALGSGFAHLLVSERTQAVERLIAGIAIRPSIADVRDALDREAVDLLDGVLEWRGSGASPVDPTALATDFGRADPGNANWARRISDSELREGLRADGRNDAGLGDRYLQSSIASARIALAVSTDEAARRTLAQSLTVQAERLLARADFTAARPLLTEAASLVGERAPAAGSADGEWSELAARLRGQLGDARPVFRPGR